MSTVPTKLCPALPCLPAFLQVREEARSPGPGVGLGTGYLLHWLEQEAGYPTVACPPGPTCQTPSELSKLPLNTYKKPPRCPWPWLPRGLWSDLRLAQVLQTACSGTWLPQPRELSVRFKEEERQGEGRRKGKTRDNTWKDRMGNQSEEGNLGLTG